MKGLPKECMTLSIISQPEHKEEDWTETHEFKHGCFMENSNI